MDNLDIFGVRPDANKFFDNGDDGTIPPEFVTNTGNDLAEKLAVAYLQRVIKYKQDLLAGYKQILFYNPPDDKRPVLKFGNLPGGIITVALDEELDARLMALYVLHGWAGILVMEQALQEALQKRETKSSEPWFVVLPFYLFTRNRLILLIRQALIKIEAKAAQEIITKLNFININVTHAWENEFRFSSSLKEYGPKTYTGSLDTPMRKVKTVYSINNLKLSGEIFLLLSEAVSARTFIDEQNRIIERTKSDIQEARDEIGPPTTSGETDLKDAQELIRRTNPTLTTLLEQLNAKAPLASLALPLLKKGFTRPEMEDTIGAILAAFYQKVDELANSINPALSMVEMNFPEGGDISASVTGLEKLYSWGFNLEALCAEKALAGVTKNLANMPLLSEQVFYHLLETGLIEKGTLAHVVSQRYAYILMGQIEEKREFEDKIKTILEPVTKIAAGMSLAAFMVNSNPAISGPLAAGSLVLGIPGMVFQIYSIIHQLSVFDQVINQRLVAVDATQVETLAGVVELAVMRAEYKEQLTQVLLKEIALLIAAKQWVVFKKALLLRGYYADLEALAQVGPEW